MRPWLILSEDERSNLIPVGYWRSELFLDLPDHSVLPHPKDFVDPQWNIEERRKVMRYLVDGYMRLQCLGPSWCRMGCENDWMGSNDFTDGTWVYPEGYVHYLDIHGVRPPEEFLEHVRANEYKMPVFSEDRIKRPQYVKPPPNTLGEFSGESSKACLYALAKIVGVFLILMVFGYLLFSTLALFN